MTFLGDSEEVLISNMHIILNSSKALCLEENTDKNKIYDYK